MTVVCISGSWLESEEQSERMYNLNQWSNNTSTTSTTHCLYLRASVFLKTFQRFCILRRRQFIEALFKLDWKQIFPIADNRLGWEFVWARSIGLQTKTHCKSFWTQRVPCCQKSCIYTREHTCPWHPTYAHYIRNLDLGSCSRCVHYCRWIFACLRVDLQEFWKKIHEHEILWFQIFNIQT